MAAKLDVSWDVEMEGKDDDEDHHEPFFMLDHLDRPFWKWVSHSRIKQWNKFATQFFMKRLALTLLFVAVEFVLL